MVSVVSLQGCSCGDSAVGQNGMLPLRETLGESVLSPMGFLSLINHWCVLYVSYAFCCGVGEWARLMGIFLDTSEVLSLHLYLCPLNIFSPNLIFRNDNVEMLAVVIFSRKGPNTRYPFLF